jgi:2-amino-4-hydroxy-6-hydroxymethyldihydropteridine diphosphokinase
MGKKAKKKGFATAYLSLGSNVGDREEYVEQAIFLLEKNPNIMVTKRSGNYETEPEGGGTQPPFINAAVEIRTKLNPFKLLEVCNEIEATLGREREIEWGPRTIDIDILLYEGEILSEDKLQIPHPLMHERMFVLKPMREIAAQLVHPVLEKTMETLFDERKAELGEKYDDELPGFKEIKGGGYDDYERW